jgi:hypothetical protein
MHALSFAALLVLCACQTPQQKKVQNAEINRQAAHEIDSICTLHGEAREAELKKVKQESCLDLYCPND